MRHPETGNLKELGFINTVDLVDLVDQNEFIGNKFVLLSFFLLNIAR